MADKDENEKTIEQDLVVTKYKMAGAIVNQVLKQILEKCVAGASVRETCEYADSLLLEETSKVFKKEKELKKGIAFPTCISVNNCICHFSPIASEPDLILKDDDMVKVDLGAHVDGFIAVVAHTIVIGSSPEKKVTGRKADVALAAHYASQAALRLLKPDTETYAITGTVEKICEAYKCKPIEGMLSHQLKQFKIDGEKTIIQNPNDAQKKEHEKYTLETHDVYAMDVLVSTGEGVGREQDTRVTIYKKTEETYQLKLKASRMFYSEVTHKHGLMPFNLRTFEDEKKAKMAVVECVNHKLIEPFQVLYEKPNEYVAQFKFTVLLMPTGPHKITGLPFEIDSFQSDCVVEDPELKMLLNSSANPKSAKKKKKKAEKQVVGEVAMEVDAKA
ncbi:GSCOCG00006496001-RA-CDS [Cotesia congregata]|uniref:Similar to Pa2g4: Proliferation-associated protein 2G4 (Rattus norvegicus) n=1 Tax=Cotesia congregata TaxID=51543 RepID=A0A8J2HLD4_COTCN|nr:GSCOCG00006496001-RA-CDS [Cotesia congregata]CAG5106316.1 Similar to Pa2g4: Proliferation-associated protein 2G4 (Rattus norvegicus) [Cotesia congregata]